MNEHSYIGELPYISIIIDDIYADLYTTPLLDEDDNDLGDNGTISFEWTCESEGQAPILCATATVSNAVIECNIELIDDEVVEEDEIEDVIEADLITVLHEHNDDELWGVMTTNTGGTGRNYLKIPTHLNPYPADQFIPYEHYSVFKNHPDVWNCSSFTCANNDDIVNYWNAPTQLAPYYSGTGDNLNPFLDWYIKVGDEWMKVNQDYSSYFTVSEDLAYSILSVERGVLGTEITSHSAGEVVEIWSSSPEEVEP